MRRNLKMAALAISWILLACLMPWISTSHAMTVSGVSFKAEIAAGETSLSLRGAGVLRYLLFIEAYAGALYLPPNVPSDQALEDVPKHLEVEYFHALKGEDFGKATLSAMRKNLDEASIAQLMPRIELHNSLYVDVQPGDRYSLTYTPGRGTVLRLNGMPRGTIEGADFAEALFGIWLGQNPIDRSFKQALLGDR